LKDTFINKLAIILAKNISSEPLSRDTLLTSINTLDKLFYEYTNWKYINSIPNEKMKILYDILLK